VAGVEVREQLLQHVDLLAQRGIARLRLLLHPLQSPLDVIAVGHQELKLQCLEVGARARALREAVGYGQDRVHLAQATEQRGPGSGHVNDSDRGGRDLARADERGHSVEPLVRDRCHADVLLAERTGRTRLRQRVEECRLARPRQAHDPDFERH
jgi:hypothetical protein